MAGLFPPRPEGGMDPNLEGHPAQHLDNHQGKILRLNDDGTVPKDNPFVGQAGALPEIWSYGHRNPQGLAVNPETNQLWETEHGPQGGDELNIVRAGRDYGWPDVSYGVQYDVRRTDGRKNVPVGNGQHSMPGVTEPVYFWVPSIAPSGMAFYTADLFPQWRGNLFVGALAGKHLIRLVLDGERVVGEERLLTELDARIRDVRQGPDGALYVLAGDSLVRLTPR
jgi:glucose/arabinose dehydrogenase